MLQEAVRTVAEAFFLLAQRIEFDEVAGNVLDFRLRPVLDFLPGTGAQLTDTGRFSFLAFVFRYLVQGVDGHKDHIVILINQLDDFLGGIAVRDSYQSGKLTDTMVDMHHIVARFKLIQLFQ